MAQYSYMKAPDPEYSFEVGDMVEVFCDHEKAGQRVRGWLKGIVVQVDAKMVAVQFRIECVPDRWLDGPRPYPVVPGQFAAYPLS